MRGGLAAAGLIALAMGQNANAVTVPTIFDTGVVTNNADGTPNTLVPNPGTGTAVDPHYSLSTFATLPTAAQLGTGNQQAFALSPSSFPASGPYVPAIGALYISPSPNSFAAPGTFYDYRTTFSLAGFIPGTASLSGGYAADDALVAVFLNGVQVAGFPLGNSFTSITPFTIGSGFATNNTLDFVVQNGPQASNNPTALMLGGVAPGTPGFTNGLAGLTLTATAVPAVPEPGSIAMLVGVGMSGAGFLVRRKRRA